MVLYRQTVHSVPKGEGVFQDLCLKLAQLEWDDPYAAPYARSGQSQQGVDITGSDKRGGYDPAGIQCKGTESNAPRIPDVSELLEEVEKAKRYKPPLALYIFAYAGQRHGPLQEKARELTKVHKASGLFEIQLWSWDDIVDRAAKYPEMQLEIYASDGYLEPVLDPQWQPASMLGAPIVATIIYAASTGPIPLEPGSRGDPGDALVDAKIDVLRDQIRAGSGKSVIGPLRALLETLPAAQSSHLRFRIFANLGAALEQTGQRDEAFEAFAAAADAELGTADSFAYRALSLMGKGHRAEAFTAAQSALALNPEQKAAAVVLIQAADESVSTADLEAKILSLTHFAEVAFPLSARFSDQGAHADALRVARGGTESTVWPQREINIAQAILHSLEGNLDARMGLPLSEGDAALLNEAVANLETASKWAKERIDSWNWLFLGANLSTAYRFLGRRDESDALALEIHELDPKNPELAERAVLAYVHNGANERALETAIQAVVEGRWRSALMAADCAAMSHNWSALQEWAERAYAWAANDQERGLAADRLILGISRNLGEPQALEKALELRSHFGASVAFEAQVAEIARRSANQEEIDQADRRLAAFDAQSLNNLERFELANAHANAGNWRVAAQLLDGLYSLNRVSEPLLLRLLFLYRADQIVAARLLYESLSGECMTSLDILRRGAAIYEKSGMLPDAITALEAALVVAPDDLASRIDWIHLKFRNGQEPEAQAWLAGADIDLSGRPEDRMEFAALLNRAGRRAYALRLAYAVLRENWGESEALHLKYVGLFLGHEAPEPLLAPDKVVVDSVVFLRNPEDGREVDYKIEAGAGSAPDVLRPEKEFARLLLGHQVGDVVELAGGFGSKDAWRIGAIKHKYVDLFHRAMEVHDQLFPGSRALGRVAIRPDEKDGFEPIFERARERRKMFDRAIQTYSEGVIPLDSLGRMLGLDVIDAGLLAGLSKVHDVRVAVVQTTIDLLIQRIEEVKSDIDRESGSLSVVGDAIALVSTSNEDKKRQLARREEMLSWVRGNCDILPTNPIETTLDMDAMFSQSAIDTIAAAIASGVPGIFEDRRYRAMASALGAKRLAWTQAFLSSLLADKRVTHADYVRWIAALSKTRVAFLTATAEDVILASEMDDPEIFERITALLQVATIERGSLISVVVKYMDLAWNLPGSEVNRLRTISRLLEKVLQLPDAIALFKTIAHLAVHRVWGSHFSNFTKGHFIFDPVFG